MIKTYPEMNAKIVEYLRISDQGIDLYAAQRIEELESKVEEMQKTLEEIKVQIPCLQDDSESPNSRHNACNFIYYLIDKALKGVNQ